MLFENGGTIRYPGVLGSLLECLLYGLGIHLTRQGTKFVIVWILNLENATPCISIIVIVSIPFGVGHILIAVSTSLVSLTKRTSSQSLLSK
jgi:hypothetical protein